MVRKYPKVEGYWVYSIKIPSNNKYYIGVSKLKCNQRWCKRRYKGMALEPYLSEWDNLIKTVIQDGLTETEALKMEDDLIQALRFIDLCVNTNRSGLVKAKDANAYNKELRKNNPEYREQIKQYQKQYYENNKERENQRNKQWRENNKEKRREYRKQYYEKNKESINEKRRQRYQKKKLEKQQQTVVH